MGSVCSEKKNALPRGPHFLSKNIYSQTFFFTVLDGLRRDYFAAFLSGKREEAPRGEGTRRKVKIGGSGLWQKNELLPRVDYVSAFANARYKNFFRETIFFVEIF